MTHREIWNYKGLRAIQRYTAEGVATVELTGLVTLSNLAELQRDCYKCLLQAQVCALIVDFRGAVVLAEAKDVPQSLGQMSSGCAAKPVANICLAIDEMLFLSHAWSMCRHGMMRAVFLDSIDALFWALDRCAVSATL